MKAIYFTFVSLLLVICKIFPQQNVLYGNVKDSITNEVIPGAIIYIEGTNISTTSDFDGNFQLKIYPGKYKLVCSYITYITYTTNLIIKNDSTYLSIALKPEQNTVLNEVKIVAEKVLNNDAGLVLMQKENKSVSDGISAELIKKTADRTTSDVLKRVSAK